MSFVTYQNSKNPHVTIHAAGCNQIAKKGGEHKYGQGEYHQHQTYPDARQYAESTKLPLIHCSYCKPQPTHQELLIPEEVPAVPELVEGAVSQVLVNAYERNQKARTQCIERYGRNCHVCGFNFGAVYGPVAEGLIHVHHLRPLSEIGGEYQVDAVKDLRPVCPNCHAVLHRRTPAFSIEEVQGFLQLQASE